MKRKIVLLLVFVMMIVAIPCTIFAAETQETADVKISASRFTVTGKSVTQKNYYFQTRPIGNVITVTYKGTDNFRFWIDENGMAVSTEPVYTFTLLHPISLTAVTTARTGDQTSVRVVFLSDYGQVISSRIYNDSEAIVFPEPLYRSGKRFIGWSYTEDDIISEMLSGEEYIAVTPVFESIDQHSIEVYYKTNDNRELQTSTIIGSGESFVATAPESFNGQPFAYWLKGDEIVSYSSKCSFFVYDNTEITAVFGSFDKCDPKIIIDGRIEDGKIILNASRTVDSSFSLVEHGIIIVTSNEFGYDSDESRIKADEALVLNGENVKKTFVSTNKEYYGNFVVNLNTGGQDRTVYAKGYISYSFDQDGEIVTRTVYSDMFVISNF